MPEDREEQPEDFDQPPSFFPYGNEEEDGSETVSSEPVEVRVEAVFAAEAEEQIQRFVLLGDGSRKLPIVIGQFETIAISSVLEGVEPERPMTHDLITSFIEKLNARVTRILIDDLFDTTYYAKIYVKIGREKEEVEIDARPSDAIAIALRTDAKVFVSERLLERD